MGAFSSPWDLARSGSQRLRTSILAPGRLHLTSVKYHSMPGLSLTSLLTVLVSVVGAPRDQGKFF